MGEMELKKIKIPFRKIGLGFLFVLATALLAVAGYLGTYFLKDYLGRKPEQYRESNSQVYKSETYNLGMRYPVDWDSQEIKPALVIFTPVVEEGETPPKEYLSLRAASSAQRPATACEQDPAECSFHANGIFGDRITTPDGESVFFTKNGSDFTVALHRYGGIAESRYTDDYFTTVFEGLTESLRFTSAAEKEEDDQGN